MISTEKQQLLDVMNSHYETVQIIYFFKILMPDGSKFRDGFASKDIWHFDTASSSTGMMVHHFKAEEKFTPAIRKALGRDPLPGEIRVAFRPLLDAFSVVFVDDVIRDTPANFLIETSPENWQAHFILSRSVHYQDAAKIQKYLIMKCTGTSRVHGDVGAASPVQPRRFPEGRFIHDTWKEALDVDSILTVLPVAKNYQQPSKVRTRAIPNQSHEGNWTDEALEQCYSRFHEKNGDLSSVDMSFAIYLFSKGLSEEFVYDAIEKVSPNVLVRHPHIEDYLLRTIGKALQAI